MLVREMRIKLTVSQRQMATPTPLSSPTESSKLHKYEFNLESCYSRTHTHTKLTRCDNCESECRPVPRWIVA